MLETDLKKTYVSLFEKHYSNLVFYATRFVDEDEAETRMKRKTLFRMFSLNCGIVETQ